MYVWFSGKLDSFMKLGREWKVLQEDMATSIGEVNDVIAVFNQGNESHKYAVRPNSRGLSEKVVMVSSIFKKERKQPLIQPIAIKTSKD